MALKDLFAPDNAKNQKWLRIFFVLGLGILLAGLYLLQQANSELIYLVALLWIFTVIILLWFGNRFIYRILNYKFPWAEHTTARFFLQLFLSTLYSLLCINLTYYFFRAQTTQRPPDLEQFLVLNVYGLLFIIPVLSINFGIFFMVQWKKAHEQSEKFKQENLRTQLESLRMHLDPHFLFNNLNVLSALIQKNPQDAQLFLDRFADVYRYVLQYKKEELVPLATELAFIRAYYFLLHQRFGDQLQLTINIAEALLETVCLPPLALQMLLENAIKHNIISAQIPLIINIAYEADGWLTVQNTRQPKKQESAPLTGTGLENIRQRYGYLSDREVQVMQTPTRFTVKLPLLEIAD
ncbi:sensor histidine kinase [Adhaeribacter rhizoryzae]|uniref:Histidine kinase n=1 Tax=Adhaeribacter rhizoryzae TaxID=2607907 RepID=A0A5M6DGZ7_9BACT|nr:histidine kinase [Adhaeribacter rhizoryzae]KAA5546801.1 histidine kinase [Adhaeribacter rhizoryzae]